MSGAQGESAGKTENFEPTAKGFESMLSVLEQASSVIALGSTPCSLAVHRNAVICSLENGDLVRVTSSPQPTVSKLSVTVGTQLDSFLVTGDDKLVFWAGGKMRIWNLTLCEDVAEIDGHSDVVNEVIQLKDGRCVTASADTTLKVWDLSQPKELATLKGHEKSVWHVAADDNGRCVSAGRDFYVLVWDLNTYEMIGKIGGFISTNSSIGVTGDGKCFATDYNSMKIAWDLDDCENGKELEGPTAELASIFLWKDYCIASTYDVAVRMWDTKTLKQVHCFEGHTHSVRCYAVTEDGLCITGAKNGLMILWDLNEKKEVARFNEHTDGVWHLAITPDGNCFSASSDQTIRIWKLRRPSPVLPISTFVNCVAVSLEGKLICGNKDSTITVWNFETNEEEATLTGHTAAVTCIVVLPNGTCVSGSKDCTVRAWNLKERVQLAQLSCKYEILCMAVWGEKCVFATYADDLQVWDAVSESALKVVPLNSRNFCLTILPEGRCAIGDDINVIRVVDLVGSEGTKKFAMHKNMVSCCTSTPDGRLLSGSWDRTLRIWEVQTQREIVAIEGHQEKLSSVLWTPDDCAITACIDGYVRVWNLKEFNIESALLCESPPTGIVAYKGGSYVITMMNGSVRMADLSQRTVIAQISIQNFELATPLTDIEKAAITRLRKGHDIGDILDSVTFAPFNFTVLHLCALSNSFKQLSAKMGKVKLTRGYFGSPLTIALEKNLVQTINEILQYFIVSASAQYDDLCLDVAAITGDLVNLLGINTPKLLPFFRVLMTAPKLYVDPIFIETSVTIPHIVHLDQRLINLSIFTESVDTEKESQLLQLVVSLPRINLTPGSKESYSFLMALAECENTTVLTAPYIQTIIDEKWNYFYWLTLGSTLAYALLFVCLLVVVYLKCIIALYAFIVFNVFFIAYEGAQVVVNRLDYFLDPWNYIDIMRCSFSVYWCVVLLYDEVPDKYLELVVLVLSFVRGFTYFRSFERTRVFVAMTLAVVSDMNSFLIILAYSLFGFGVFTSLLVGEEKTIAEAWLTGYGMIVGDFNNSKNGTVEWIIFTGATVINVVIMMNLLISILGDAFGRTQETFLENDLHQKLELMIEYESMMFTRRNAGKPTVILALKEVEVDEDDDDSALIVKQTKEVQESLQEQGKVLKVIEGKCTNLENKMEEKITNLENKMEEKIAKMEEKIDAIIGLMKARS